ncbi:sensor histidine kinase [Paenibacillus glucanolyticus]
MSKLSKKLIIRITLVLSAVFIVSLALNTYFLPKYVLYQQKQKLAEVSSHVLSMEKKRLLEEIAELEQTYRVTIVYADLAESEDQLNDRLKTRLNEKRITLSRFWLTTDNIDTLREGGRVNKIYDQPKLKSNFLVNFLPMEGNVVAVGESIPYTSDTISMVNQFNVYIWSGALVVLILLSVLFTTRIVKPLAKLNETAEAISNLTFTKADIRTGDEVEELAERINSMSTKLESAHVTLEGKNEELRRFIADISHELRTPLALIKAYATGIQDGLDDGTYTEIIRKKTDDMTEMVDRLLLFSKLQVEPYTHAPVEIRQLLTGILDTYRLSFEQQGLSVQFEDLLPPEGGMVMADEAKLASVFHNLLTNAMKYTADETIRVRAERRAGVFHFEITNAVGPSARSPVDWDHVWEPFYVMESSRSKLYSGTGLGLSIVRTILEKHHAIYGVRPDADEVTFYFSLPFMDHHSDPEIVRS